MSQLTEAQVLDALRPIVDPDFGRSIVDLGFVRDVAIDGGRVAFKIVLTTPACPVKAEFERAARERVAALPGVSDVRVEMGADTRGRGGAAARSAAAGDVLPGVRNTLAVASGTGGVGKSNTAVNLALGLAAAGARVGLLDADVYGPSLPTLLGVSERPGTEERGERKVILPVERHGMKLMSMGFFITESSPVIWRGPMVHGLIRQFLTDVEWGELDYLVIDLPPGTGDAALTLTQQAPLSGAVIVTTPNDLSTVDARKAVKMFEKVNVPVLGVIENMAWFTPPDLPDRRYFVFGRGGGERMAKELGVEFLGQVPIDPRVAEGGDVGRPIVEFAPDSEAAAAFRELAGTVARRLAVLAARTPKLADASIQWVTTPG
jgi:ATP-binding protein involved in chromosome partitioning